MFAPCFGTLFIISLRWLPVPEPIPLNNATISFRFTEFLNAPTIPLMILLMMTPVCDSRVKFLISQNIRGMKDNRWKLILK